MRGWFQFDLFQRLFSVWLMNHDDYPLDHVTVHIKQWSTCTLVAARHYIVMELRGNLTKDFRGEALARFFDASFKCLGAWVDGGRRRLNWPDSAWNEDEHFDELSYQGRNSTTDTTHFIIFISLQLMPPAFAGLEIASSMARSTTKSSSNNSTILSIASSMARSTTKSNSNSSNNQQQQ